ncbi:MAG TPA: dTDP-4-dehydrorhamnose reductase [Candidatus Sulfomarinibacteraceae bacterium]|nr:dTDP-4-dehydrorhamnose reductase [Candidatus Sulfomarinibacteraceae bacterium]
MAHTWLITGAHGQLGRALAAGCASRGLSCEGRDLDTLDICDADAVDEWIVGARPQVVVNCAALTAVDDCEADPERAMRVNGTAVGHLGAACDRVGARLVQVSTDYVFAGDGARPYREDDPVAPRSVYGRSKLRGEELAARAEGHLIVRTAWLYGGGGHNFVAAIRRQIDKGARPLRVVADQRGSPTYCDDLAQAIIDLVGADAGGVVHAVNSGETTWHGFAEEIVRRIGAEVEVLPVATSEYPRPAPRPAYSVLDAARLERLLHRKMPPWQDALRRYLVGP